MVRVFGHTRRAVMASAGGTGAGGNHEERRSSLKDMVSMWDHKLHGEVSSSSGGGAATDAGATDYGHPPPGSLTEKRALDAATHIDAEVDKLCDNIRLLSKGTGKTTFGELFAYYVDISNTFMGMLQRAKKRGRVKYEGDMLFQGPSDHVVIALAE